MQPISAYYSSDEEQDEEDILLYLPIAPEIEDPEDGWNPATELEDGSAAGNKRGHQDQKENSSPKKKRTKSYEIALTNAPSDGKKVLILGVVALSNIFLTFFAEVHPLVSSKNKDKPSMVGGKKVTGPGRPRNSDSGKRFERGRSGK